MKKILIMALGGTIGAKSGDVITSGNPLEILNCSNHDDVIFDTAVPITLFSENANAEFYSTLINYISGIEYDEYCGVIILHGSDTLTYTGAILANLYPTRNIVLVAANKPLDDKTSNGISNFNDAIEHILQNKSGVFISYNGIKAAYCTTRHDTFDDFEELNLPFAKINQPSFHKRNILVIDPTPVTDYTSYNIENIDCVLHTMYHSATAPSSVKSLTERCSKENVPFYFCTCKSKTQYETAQDFNNILFSTTTENAIAQLMLKKSIDKI